MYPNDKRLLKFNEAEKIKQLKASVRRFLYAGGKIKYLKNCDYEPVGVALIQKSPAHNDKLLLAVSLCGPGDKYSKVKGLEIAFGRLNAKDCFVLNDRFLDQEQLTLGLAMQGALQSRLGPVPALSGHLGRVVVYDILSSIQGLRKHLKNKKKNDRVE